MTRLLRAPTSDMKHNEPNQSSPRQDSIPSIGLDFGTTNSAIAMLRGAAPFLASFDGRDGRTETFASILYLEQIRDATGRRLTSSAGPKAIERYLEAESKGRLIQSLKAYLADKTFDGTTVLSRRYSLENLIALILKHLLSEAVNSFGVMPTRAVVGRPVHFSSAQSNEDDSFAVERLLMALKSSGLQEIVFEFEPVAAAYSYERTLTDDELILIGDFGGGTSDFSLLHVGPSVRGRGRTSDDIIGTGGVAVAGDAFDKQIVRNLVAPRFGRGSEYVSPPAKFLPMPEWPYEKLERWHYVSFINTRENLAKLESLRVLALLPERIEALIHLIENELGYQLHEAVRRTKFELSDNESAVFEFDCAPISISKRVTREDFESWIQDELDQMSRCIDDLLARTRTSPDAVDHVFLTGGSSFVPAVRRLFSERFGSHKLAGGNELTSVAAGLALRAAERWP
jgi:hypothetical chaperone protein